MHCRIVTHLIILATVISQSVVAGELIIAPESIESKVGDTTYFNCSTNLTSREIFWHHGDKYIYTGETILRPYLERFVIDRNASNGSHNLVIHSVELSDAGKYICIDDDGIGTRQSAELVVLDNDPDCQSNIQPDGVIGQNTFNIPPDEVQLTCTVTYHGNTPPQMEWKKIGEKRSIKDNVTSNVTSNNRLIYTLKFTGDIALDYSSYVCQTTRSTQKQYKCNSETIKVLYFIGGNMTEQNVIRGGEITCMASNSTFPCISQWYHGNYSCPLSCDETISTHLLGEYLCTVKCNVRGKDYYFEALKAVVVEATTFKPPSISGTIAASVVVPIVMVALIAVCVVLYHKRKDERLKSEMKQAVDKLKREKQEDARLMELEKEELETLIREDEQRFQKAIDLQLLDTGDEQIAVLYSKDGVQNRVKRVRPRDKVAEEEIELVNKISEEEEEAIRGVAILSGKLFIVRQKTSKLEVYECSNFNPDRESPNVSELLNVPRLVDAVDICSCKKNNCLYIMDKKDGSTRNEVLKISTEGDLLGNWSTVGIFGGYLSATIEGNVIITVQLKHMLLEYSSDGNLVRDIKLQGRINPRHAIKLDNGLYIVSHGSLFDRFHRVCHVDKDGQEKKSFGRESGSADNQLNAPYYLAATSKGYVMVADLGNNRVLLLDPNLEFTANIVPKYKQRFECPRRVYLDETLSLLVVVITKGNTEEGNPEGVEASQLIEKDCRLLVFNIEPLLQKYTKSH